MNPRVAIIVQGRANNLNDIKTSYKKCRHDVIFSTFDPVSSSQLNILVNPTPTRSGSIFHHSEGVLNALNLFKNSHQLFLKIRSDFIIDPDDVNKFIDVLVKKYSKNKKIMAYSASFNAFSCVQDWMIFGTYEQLKNYFTIHPKHYTSGSAAESVFYKSYLEWSRYPIVNVRESDQYFDFFILDIILNNIKINVFKGRTTRGVDIKHYGLVDKTHNIYFGNR